MSGETDCSTKPSVALYDSWWGAAGTYGQRASLFFIRWCIGTQTSVQATWEAFPELGGFALCLLLLLSLSDDAFGGQQSKSWMQWAGPPARQLTLGEQQPASHRLTSFFRPHLF